MSRTEVDRPLAVVDAVNTLSPTLWFVHVDHLNRPKKMTDGAKASVWEADWAPWGAPHAITGTAALDARFPGQWYQLEAGLHYNWHRHYDPTLGRYTQPDPLGFVDGPSVFAYAGNSPQAWVDPEGTIIPQLFSLCRLIPKFCSKVAKQTFDKCFGRGGLLNQGPNLRIGVSRKGGRSTFRAAGRWVEKLTGRKHIDFKDLGPL